MGFGLGGVGLTSNFYRAKVEHEETPLATCVISTIYVRPLSFHLQDSLKSFKNTPYKISSV